MRRMLSGFSARNRTPTARPVFLRTVRIFERATSSASPPLRGSFARADCGRVCRSGFIASLTDLLSRLARSFSPAALSRRARIASCSAPFTSYIVSASPSVVDELEREPQGLRIRGVLVPPLRLRRARARMAADRQATHPVPALILRCRGLRQREPAPIAEGLLVRLEGEDQRLILHRQRRCRE